MPTRESGEPLSRLHVLVVNDDLLWLDKIRRRLSLAGFRVSVTDLVQNLEARLASSAPDLLMIDVLMPGLSGSDLARLLNAQRGSDTLKIVLLSPVPPAILRTLVDTTGALGIVHATNDERFLDELTALAEGVLASAYEQSTGSSRPAPLFSGTHRIGGSAVASEPEVLAAGGLNRKRA